VYLRLRDSVWNGFPAATGVKANFGEQLQHLRKSKCSCNAQLILPQTCHSWLSLSPFSLLMEDFRQNFPDQTRLVHRKPLISIASKLCLIANKTLYLLTLISRQISLMNYWDTILFAHYLRNIYKLLKFNKTNLLVSTHGWRSVNSKELRITFNRIAFDVVR